MVERLAREIQAVAASESFRQRLTATYLIPSVEGPAAFAAFIAGEAKRWGAAAQGVNLRGE